MKTKGKVAAGISFLFILIIAMGCAGIYFVTLLSKDSSDIIKDNLASLNYVESIKNEISDVNDGIELMKLSKKGSYDAKESILDRMLDSIDKKIKAEASNITETGEQQAVDSLKLNFAEYKKNIKSWDPNSDIEFLYYSNLRINKNLSNIYRLNQNAILKKSAIASHTATNAITYISIIGTIFFLVAFVFITNFPGYIANPIRELSDKIRAIADGDFNQRLEMNARADEFGMVTTSFNYLAKKLQEFRDSNIAEITTQKSRIESLILNLDEGIILLNENQQIVVANTVAANLLGISAEVLVGKASNVIASKNDLFKMLVRDFPNPSNDEKAPIRITLDGEENYFQRYVHPIFSYDEWKQLTKPAGFVIVMKNITEFKKLDIAKTNFMATISHELKTPLSSINLSLKLILDERIGKLSPEQTQLVDNIRHESQRLLKYVNELLDFSQIESGNIKLTLTKADAADIVRQSIDAMKPTLEQKRLHTETVIEEKLPLIKADAEKTLWVITNLIANAARFSSEGGKIIIAANHNPGMVRFSVQDFGPGIDSRYHEKVFERFVQVYSNGNKGGTGLGLAIAKDFIEAQGGKIWVESEPGEGSKFIFELPLAI
jgi:two-component system, NtrC family, sensor histidine kinase KinB